jgi:hypothetical protein
MVAEQTARSILRFFFFVELDEERALHATDLCLKELAHAPTAPGGNEWAQEQALWRAVRKVWLKSQKRQSSHQSIGFSYADWIVPRGVELGPWLDFRRRSDREEFFVVLMHFVLGVGLEALCECLEESLGTVRHRLNRGLRTLAHCMPDTRPA